MNLDDLDDDIRDHLERETLDNIARGLSPDEARYAALRKFGNVTRIKEDTRAVWSFVWLEQLHQDARYAFRALRRDPVFAAIILLTLAFGIAMNTAVFSVINSVLLRPVAYPNPDRLVWLADYDPHLNRDIVGSPDFFAWRESAQSFSGMAAYSPDKQAVQSPAGIAQAEGLVVAGDFWAITSPRPAFGRLFGPDEQNVAVLSWDFFAREFASNFAIVGTSVSIDGRPVTIVGVLPADFRFQFPMWWAPTETNPVDVYLPLPGANLGFFRGVSVVAALKKGVRIEQAFAEVELIEQRLLKSPGRPRMPFPTKFRAEPLQEKLVGGVRRPLIVLFGAGAFVLVIAAVNAANLLLARAATRKREIAIRTALGAGGLRVIRQLLVESIVIAMVSGAAGVIIAQWALRTLIHLAPNAIPRLTETTIDARVLIFTLAISILTAILFGTAPAISLSQSGLHSRLKDGTRIATGLRFRRFLVAGELALAIVLLTGAGLMLKSFWHMNVHPSGFHPEQVLTLQLRLTGSSNDVRPAQNPDVKELLQRLNVMPGVRAAGTSTWLLYSGTHYPKDPPGADPRVIRINASSPGYLRALGMRLVKGRWLTDSDPANIVLVNESMARQAFEGDPIGQTITITKPSTVVGVVADLNYTKLDAEPAPEIFVPYREYTILRSAGIVVASANPNSLISAVRRTVAEINPAQAIYDVKTLDQALAETIAPRRFNLFLLASFAAVALVLAIAGVYGVVAYSVAERTREIGVRIALGARTAQVVRMVVLDGMTVALGGIFLGSIAAWYLVRLLTNLLYAVRADDPLTFGAVAAILAATALVACCGPALKAATIDPAVALRHD
jgi:putative ABC transport system permease protein